ncbi:FkbM family methyltransferase [Massilibacteroides vaginae]|uniref:FkbM family methyltransferase n=1 Tax=Massilibacteroides vaginae TaxID=1673718 RepID=UPI000A1CED13|nr:FkbM family methyltransferase [Massilibacteroides vaginae]
MLADLYRAYIPLHIREKIYSFCLGSFLSSYRRSKAILKANVQYYFYWLFSETEQNQMYRFISKYGLTPYPWLFTLEYETPAKCFHDKHNGLTYIIHNNRKLFFPKELSISQIQYIYRSLVIEQDIRSAHRYLANDYSMLQDMIILDIGGAEGIFSLDAIEFAQHIYLFECDPMWTDALNATFAPWKQKFTLVSKYITNKESNTETTIDSFLSSYNYSNLFFKMDIEGAELSALHGAEITLKRQNIKMSVCTYHTPTDAEKIESYLISLGYKTSFTDGYLYINYHFNKGILRASKE